MSPAFEMSKAEAACGNSLPGVNTINNKPRRRIVVLGYTIDHRRRYNEGEGRNCEEGKEIDDVKKVDVVEERRRDDEVEDEDDGVDEEKPLIAISPIHIIII